MTSPTPDPTTEAGDPDPGVWTQDDIDRIERRVVEMKAEHEAWKERDARKATTEAGRAEPVEVLSEEEKRLVEMIRHSCRPGPADHGLTTTTFGAYRTLIAIIDRLASTPPPDPTEPKIEVVQLTQADIDLVRSATTWVGNEVVPEIEPDDDAPPDPTAGAMRVALEEALRSFGYIASSCEAGYGPAACVELVEAEARSALTRVRAALALLPSGPAEEQP